MTVEGIVFLSLITFIAVLFVVKSTMQDVLLKKYKERISNNEKENSVVMKYCLNSILEKSVEIEDYETAKRCKMLIENLNKHEKTIQKIKAIKRKNGLWIAYMEGKELMAQARTKSAAILLFSLGQFNIKN